MSFLNIKFILFIAIFGALCYANQLSAQIFNYWGKGSMAISCAPQTFNLTSETYDDGHVVGIIDIRNTCDFNKLVDWPDTGEVYPNKFYYQAGNAWKFSSLGMVFPLAVDELGNIYVGGTSTFGSVAFPDGPFPNGQRGSGSIHKINGNTGNVNTNFVNTRQANSFNPLFPNGIPNKTVSSDLWGIDLEYNAQSGPGLGDLAYNKYHKFLYASNFEDGNIYKIDPSTGTILHQYDPRFGDNSSNGIDNGADGFSPRGQRPWALGINKEGSIIKLYYSNWRVDTRDTFPEKSAHNEIWSVELDLLGNTLPMTEKLEITIPYLSLNHPERPFNYSSNPVSDMDFSDNGEMYLSERGMDYEYGRYIGVSYDISGNLIPNPKNIANHARILRYNLFGSIWNLHNANDKFYELGHDVATNRSLNASGGISLGNYLCPQGYLEGSMVYATGDFDNIKPDAFVYGVLGMEYNTGDFNNHIYLDFDATVANIRGGTSPKTTPGDNEVWEGLPSYTLACDNKLNVSLDTGCCVTITPDMVLQGNYPLNCLKIILKDKFGHLIPTSPRICGPYIGQLINYTLLDTCTGNSCWGEILVEDKYPPEVICPPDDTVFCNRTNYLLLQPTVTEFCSSVTKHTIEDRMDMFDCAANPLDSIIGKRTIRYYYTDASGNRSDTCTQCIYFQKFRVTDIVWPADKVFSCENHDTIPPIDSTGVPMVDGEPIFPSWGACKIVATYEDQYIAVCPKSFKVIRKWTVIDWCMPSPFNIYTYNQLIKVVDDRGPIIACPNSMIVSTDVWSCTGTVIVPFPTIISECSNVRFEVGYKIKGPGGTPTFEGTSKQNITRLPNGFMITGLPLDSNWVVFRATDECGNFTDCATEVVVADQVPPVPVCDQKTVVSLTLDGTAKIEAFTFDDRSHDNCGISKYEAKRMDNGLPCNDTLRSRSWGPYVYFCCEDINKTIMVSMRVWDHSGNFNVCMVEVDVQDKTIPLVVCPPDITVSCSYDFTSYDVFGTVRENIADRKNITINNPNVIFSGQRIDGYAFDGCGFVLVEKPTVRGNCGRDTIFRLFEATDQGGLKGSCTQRIVIRDYNPDNVTITWPNDYITQTVCIQMENINPDITGRPVIHGADKCNSMFTKYTDQPFVNDPDACIKIIRTWEVIDWCVYQPNNPETKGYWQWKQIVKIINKVPPIFINDCKNRTVDVFGPGCGGHVDLIGYAIDDCTDSLSLKWYYEVDLYNDGKADLGFSGASRNASGNYPLGTHKVIFRVWDGCDNISFCSFLLTVRDGKKPTPYCHSSIVTTVMPSGKFVEIWAKDYNINSEDNCTPKDSLKYFFKTDTVFHSSLRLDCGHIGLNIIRMYVFDQAGNYDYCEVTIEVQDPNKVCPNSLTIQGKLTTVSNKALSNVEVQLVRNNPSSSTLAYTDANGIYAFNMVSSNINYVVKPIKNQDFVNGVTGQDIVMIQRHILGQENLNSAYRTIAADANNNGFVTASDITEIRKLILGVISKYQNNNSWRFVPMAHQFADPNKPASYPETIGLNPISKNEMNTNFYAIKIGDVSGDASVNGLTNSAGSRTAPILINLPLQSFEVGEELIVPIKLNSDMSLSGLQLGLTYDQSKLSFERFENGSISIHDEEYYLGNGQIKMLNALPADLKIKQDVTLFYLVFKTIDQGSTENVLALTNQDEFSSEIYDDKISANSVELNFRSGEENLISGVKLFHNEPNPFSQQTQINFELSDNQYVEFILYETNGKIIRKMNKEYSQGLHSLTIKGNELPGSGIYFLQMNSGETTETRRLVYIK